MSIFATALMDLQGLIIADKFNIFWGFGGF